MIDRKRKRHLEMTDNAESANNNAADIPDVVTTTTLLSVTLLEANDRSRPIQDDEIEKG